MASPRVAVELLTPEERIALIGELWDSLDPHIAAPITPSLAAELDRRETEADAQPEAGEAWVEVEMRLRERLR
jgi:putative addiction module component (TIGR02574 family)